MHGSEAWIPCMDSVHRHGHSEREAADSVPCINTAVCTAIALHRFISSESPSEALHFWCYKRGHTSKKIEQNMTSSRYHAIQGDLPTPQVRAHVSSHGLWLLVLEE